MSKELEKEYLADLDHYDEGMGIHSTSYEKCKERLIRLAKIDNAKPSEALKDLNEIIEYITEDKKIKYKATILFDCKIIKDALQKSQEMEKELEEVKADLTIELHNKKNAIEMYKEGQILRKEQEKVIRLIMEKDVDIVSLKQALSVKQYNSFISFRINYMEYMNLTQEEFELLKR